MQDKKPLISHEVPLCLLEHSKRFNDYQYFLPHLADTYPEYLKFFIKCKEEGIMVMADNSLHELGVPYGEQELLTHLELLQPSEFIVPDYWGDYASSTTSSKYWMNSYQEMYPDVKFIAVVQASNFEEALKCFIVYKMQGYKKIAITYGLPWYEELGEGSTSFEKKMNGRIKFIDALITNELIEDIKLHLLGCNLPQEFKHYTSDKKYNFIETIDTSNPVMAAIEGMKYDEFGLDKKPTVNLNSHFGADIQELDTDLIKHNVLYFKRINNL
jgi:hypothetical protein